MMEGCPLASTAAVPRWCLSGSARVSVRSVLRARATTAWAPATAWRPLRVLHSVCSGYSPLPRGAPTPCPPRRLRVGSDIQSQTNSMSEKYSPRAAVNPKFSPVMPATGAAGSVSTSRQNPRVSKQIWPLRARAWTRTGSLLRQGSPRPNMVRHSCASSRQASGQTTAHCVAVDATRFRGGRAPFWRTAQASQARPCRLARLARVAASPPVPHLGRCPGTGEGPRSRQQK